MNTTQKGFIIPLVAVVLILLGAYIYYSARSSSDVLLPATTTNTTVGTITPPSGKILATAGIIVTSPLPNDLVMLPLVVEGAVNGIGWFVNEGEAGTVEVFDAEGKSLSNVEILMTVDTTTTLPASFRATVGDREMMSHITTDTGVVRFTNQGAKDGDAMQMLEVPVKFR
jgi:hypothetical protein